MTKQTIRKLLISLAAAAAVTAVCRAGLLYRLDNMASDALYQRPIASAGDILILGIDARSLDDLGRFQDWDRSIMTRALTELNSDPANRPAAIGIDVLYIGATEPEQDAALAEAAALADNVVVACYAEFGSGLTQGADGEAVWDDFLVKRFEEPYAALREHSRQGHINAMLDNDGVLRNSLLYIDTPDGRRVSSFNWELYRLFAEAQGFVPEAPEVGSRGFWTVPYTGEPGAYYEGFGVSALLSGEVDPALYAGRIVLIGPYTSGLQDSYWTPMSGEMFGVEYQANCVEALIRGEYDRYVSRNWQAVLLFFVSFGCLYWFLDRKLKPVTAIWLVMTGSWVGICIAVGEAGLLLQPLWIPVAVTVMYIAAVAGNYVRAALEKHRVTGMFKKYVAPEVVNEILRQDADALVTGKLTDIAVLFVDIRGFTPMSEMLSPPEVVGILNRYLTLTSDCIMRNQGTLDKFIGDATMAFWGAPLPQEDIIFKAVKTALDMVEGSKALSEELTERYGRAVSFGIGVHYGPAVVGSIGAPHRMDYTAIGDTVNTTARLEANAPPGKLYISRVVADALEGRIRVVSMGDGIKLKGKAEGFEVLSVEGLI